MLRHRSEALYPGWEIFASLKADLAPLEGPNISVVGGESFLLEEEKLLSRLVQSLKPIDTDLEKSSAGDDKARVTLLFELLDLLFSP